MAALALACLGTYVGCSVDSSDEFYRDVGVDFTGYYTPKSGDRIVVNNSGAAITTLNLIQTGDDLQAVDNNGRIFKGTIGEVIDQTASFTMEGPTTTGSEGTFAGNLRKTGDTSADMSGTWVEADRFSTFAATGSVSPTPTNDPSPTNSTNTNDLTRTRLEDWSRVVAGAQTRLWFLAGQSGFEELGG